MIGAGPAGLAVAACLRKRGAPFTIVEQSMAVGSSWRGHYDRVHLHTDRAHSALPFLGFPEGTPRYPSREQVITERRAVGENGLYFCGFSVTPTGMFREMGIEARRIAGHITRAA